MSNEGYNSYLNQDMLPYSFCPGCGHATIVDALDAALVKLQLDPRQVVLVTDIGCAGLSDRYFDLNAMHGLHGRSVTYATGIKLVNPSLKVIVAIGDGGCGIGGNHLVNAARRNIGVAVLVFNNLNYGMTGGEQSATTPPGGVTATTRYGNLERPLDICTTVSANGAGFVARTTAFDHALPGLIAQAIQHDGFALVDIWELCTAYYVPNNRFSKKLLLKTIDSLGFSTGILHQEARPEYSRAYRQAVASQLDQAIISERPLTPKYPSDVSSRLHWVIAGAAGARVGTTASALSRGALLSGLWAAQRNDYPVTVRSGYSLSEVIISPCEVRYAGGAQPDAVVVLSPEGLAKVRPLLVGLAADATLYIDAALLPVETTARVIPLDLKGVRRPAQRSVVALAEVLRHAGLYPIQAFKEALAMRGTTAEQDLAAIEAGFGKVISDHPVLS